MALIQYDVVPIAQGWQVKCNGVTGPPYSELSDAVLDTLSMADELRKQGDRVRVRLLRLDGTRSILETRDAPLFARR